MKWKKGQLVFVNSMSDLLHEEFGLDYIVQVCEVMKSCPQHTFQVLTKRAQRLNQLLNSELREYAELENIWWGVSVENKAHGVPRIDLLRKTPAKTKFLSCEPLLEDLGSLDLSNIQWVIVGGESGHKFRAMDEQWALSIRDQCKQQKVAFFFKQWAGSHPKKLGRLLDGQEYNEYPEVQQ